MRKIQFSRGFGILAIVVLLPIFVVLVSADQIGPHSIVLRTIEWSPENAYPLWTKVIYEVTAGADGISSILFGMPECITENDILDASPLPWQWMGELPHRGVKISTECAAGENCEYWIKVQGYWHGTCQVDGFIWGPCTTSGWGSKIPGLCCEAPTPTDTPTPTPTSTTTPVRQIFLPLVIKETQSPCGLNNPDLDEPDNDSCQNAHDYTYSMVRRTWHSGQDVIDCYRYYPAWSGLHWFWSDTLDPLDQRISWTVYNENGMQLVRGEAYGQGDLGVYLFSTQTYCICVENINADWLPPGLSRTVKLQNSTTKNL